MSRQKRIDFIISNPGHHAAMFAPVVGALAQCKAYVCRFGSLCEFRGFATPPASELKVDRDAVYRVVPIRVRRSPSLGMQGSTGPSGPMRSHARNVVWRLVLRPRVRTFLSDPPAVAVLPNDAAFPYDRIAAVLRRAGIPFVLVQEGIRFSRPAAAKRETYGTGGARAFAVWGEGSAEYFRGCGVAESLIHVTGNPRFDEVATRDWSRDARMLRDRLGIGSPNVLLLTNPIDDLGFCTTRAKLQLVARFVAGLRPLFEEDGIHLTVKTHPRESVRAYTAALAPFLETGRVTVTGSAPLYPLIETARAAVVIGSSAGLEALLRGLSLGVLEVPGHGFLHDYVQQGAAVGIRWDLPLADQVRELLSEEARRSAAGYVRRNLHTAGAATERIADLISFIAEER